MELASKIGHQFLVEDPDIQALLGRLALPPPQSKASLKELVLPFRPTQSSVTHILAIDGGYAEIPLPNSFPESRINFFQFGALLFSLDALAQIGATLNPNPEDVSKLNSIERIKLALPVANARLRDSSSLLNTIRRILDEFLRKQTMNEDYSLQDTLEWFLFRQYKGREEENGAPGYPLSGDPNRPGERNFSLTLSPSDKDGDGIYHPKGAAGDIYLCDVFRFHEVINDVDGAGGISGYLCGVLEHLILLHIIRKMLRFPDVLERALFIMDRPVGFFGQTAQLCQPMRDLVAWLHSKGKFFMAGLEKSGVFVEHARQIAPMLEPGSILIMDNDYIYKNIMAPRGDASRPYGDTSYYGHKVIFKSRQGNIYVVSVPGAVLKCKPESRDLPHLREILTLVEALKCDMYENALLPVSLVNKLTSLSQVPGSKILEQFAASRLKGGG